MAQKFTNKDFLQSIKDLVRDFDNFIQSADDNLLNLDLVNLRILNKTLQPLTNLTLNQFNKRRVLEILTRAHKLCLVILKTDDLGKELKKENSDWQVFTILANDLNKKIKQLKQADPSLARAIDATKIYKTAKLDKQTLQLMGEFRQLAGELRQYNELKPDLYNEIDDIVTNSSKQGNSLIDKLRLQEFAKIIGEIVNYSYKVVNKTIELVNFSEKVIEIYNKILILKDKFFSIIDSLLH